MILGFYGGNFVFIILKVVVMLLAIVYFVALLLKRSGDIAKEKHKKREATARVPLRCVGCPSCVGHVQSTNINDDNEMFTDQLTIR